MTRFEYTQQSCAVWQIAHLCNHFAEFGWDVVAVVESKEGVQVDEQIGNPDAGQMYPVKAYEVVFRRPVRDSDDDEERGA